ncbi:MAG TPA: hypothetical protein VEM41_09745 [Actinomycetota bacterium]|nr:hypothetical protein [Actinomycetota bacterium]
MSSASEPAPPEGEAGQARVIALPVRPASWCPECGPGEEPRGDREAVAFLSHLATRHPATPAGRAARDCLAGLHRGAVS